VHRAQPSQQTRPRAARRARVGLAGALALLVGVLGVPGASAADPVTEARHAVEAAEDRLADAYAELDAARAQVADAEARATEAAERLAAAEVRHTELSTEIIELERRIERTNERIRHFRRLVRARAVAAYMGGPDTSTLDVFEARGVVDAVRRAELLGSAKDHEDEILDELGRLEDELDRHQSALEADREELVRVIAALTDERDRVIQELTEVRNVVGGAEAEVSERQTALAAAQTELATAEAEAEEQVPPPPVTPPDDGPAPFADILCPIDGPVAFADTWRAPRPGGRTHEGIDIFSPGDAPNVAVVSGRIKQEYGDRQGNGVFLYGDDGNSYWYFHLARYEGRPRRVEQGEVIGYTGDSGNARPGEWHTHFEYHPGNGGPRNPYPIVAAAC
jgi:peptidoglycan hydrolase CwlO-like protein